jgi:hypothetical protein
MTEIEYQAVRASVLRREDPPAELIDECRRVVSLLIRTAGLPAHYSPYGVWSDEAIEEVLADWIEVRLVSRGQLLAIMQRAPGLRVFRRMAETSVRQHLIDSLKRSQSSNLFDRVSRCLENDVRFEQTGSAHWQLCDEPAEPFVGDDRDLLAAAWSLGEFTVIRYEPEARKLSPLLDGDELDRFLTGMLKQGAMSAATIMQALRMRFAIEDQAPEAAIDPELGGGDQEPEYEALLADLVTATLAELTSRQAAVLVGLDQKLSGSELAGQLGCSAGTISYERRQIEDILARLGADAPAVLKRVLDALFKDNA